MPHRAVFVPQGTALRRTLLRMFATLFMIVLVGSALPAAAAAPPAPTYGPAVKDGNPDTGGAGAEWQYRPSAGYPDGYDYWGGMYVAGDATKQRLGSAYLRYVCPVAPATVGTMYVLVLQNGYPGTPVHGSPVDPLLTSPSGNAWAKFGGTGGSGTKLYNDSNPGQVLWIGLGYDGNSTHAQGYEASFLVAPGSYANFVVHAEALNAAGAAATAGTVGFNTGADPLVISCPTTDNPAVTVVKTTNGADANSAPGLPIPVGGAVTWQYVVTNNGNVALSNVTVTDDKLTAAAISCGGGSNVIASLAVGASATCTASGTAVAGQYENIGTAQGTSPAGKVIQDSDPSHYFGTTPENPAISIVKTTNGTDNDSAPGLPIPVGGAVTWQYVVTNNGNVALSNVTVTDDKLTAAAISCGGGSNVIASLAVGASATCTASGTAVAGQYENIGTAQGTSPAGAPVQASNPDHYFGSAPALLLDKTATPVAYGLVGDIISYEYLVTNAGNVTLSGPFTVSDDKTTVTCPPTASLAPGASITCTATYTITQADLDAGSVTNTATATNGTVTSNPASETVTALQNPQLVLEKTATPGSYNAANQVISYSYKLTNAGNVTLSGPFTVSDDKTTVTCPPTASLAPGASITCTATYTITQADLDAGSVTNTATATNGTVTSNTDSETVIATQNLALLLEKTATPGSYNAANQVISYSYKLTNVSNVTLSGPFTVSDDKTTVTCPPTASLAPGASITCTATYTITQADLDAGSVTNTATATNGTVTSNPASETVTALQNPQLVLEKTATPGSYNAANQVISYSYKLTNAGNVTLSGPFTVSDDKTTVTCPPTASLAPGASITCTATYTITQADLDAGSVTNMATATNGTVTSNTDSETVIATQNLALLLEKTATPGSYNAANQVISYSYKLTNVSNVTLSGPFTVSDDKTTVTCPPTASLAPGASITCTATYTITQADLGARSVTNTAQGSAAFGGTPVLSNPDSETVTNTLPPPRITVTKVVTQTALQQWTFVLRLDGVLKIVTKDQPTATWENLEPNRSYILSEDDAGLGWQEGSFDCKVNGVSVGEPLPNGNIQLNVLPGDDVACVKHNADISGTNLDPIAEPGRVSSLFLPAITR